MQNFLLQLDFNSRTIFNIEKGIIKKQFPFSQVKGCEDTERRRFSIAFHGRQDYELEAVSLDDKRKVNLSNTPVGWWHPGRAGGMGSFHGCWDTSLGLERNLELPSECRMQTPSLGIKL